MGNWTQKDRAQQTQGVDNISILEETALDDVNFVWT
jgi:hypothetical protein